VDGLRASLGEVTEKTIRRDHAGGVEVVIEVEVDEECVIEVEVELLVAGRQRHPEPIIRFYRLVAGRYQPQPAHANPET
jgi:hypothetical protein